MLEPAELAGTATLAEPRLDPTGRQVAWVVADADGVRVRVASIHGEGPRDLAGPDPRLRGGVLDWAGDGALVVAAAEGGLWRLALDGGDPHQLAADERAEAVAVSPGADRVAYVADQRAVRVVALDGGEPITVSDEADFALDPAWSPDGRRLAWHCWDVPHMPWDRSRIVLAPAEEGARPVTVAGGSRPRSVAQPRWLADGRIGWLDDRDGFMVPYVARADGTEEHPILHDVHLDHAPPTWGAGIRSWDVSPDATFLVADRNEDGFGRLVVHRLDNGEGASLGKGVHAGVGWRGGRVAAVRSGARTPPQLVVYEMADLAEKIEELAAIAVQHEPAVDAAEHMERSPEWIRERVREATLRTGQLPLARPSHRTVVQRSTDLDVSDLPEPEVLRFSAGGRTAAARFYAPSGEPPHPTVVWTHGGPHDQLRVEWKHRLAFLVARGWAILTVDHRGTTGHGREWTQSLRHEWGEADVADTIAAVEAVVERGLVDPERVLAAGSSAGGFTTLNLLAHHPDRFAGGIALYPVADLAGLRDTTHRFEAHYSDGLVGEWPEHADRYRERSPVTVAHLIKGPLLVLHGSDDEVVPVAQAAELVAGVAADAEVDLHVYPGEGHGWHRPDVVVDELDRLGAFLDRIDGGRR